LDKRIEDPALQSRHVVTGNACPLSLVADLSAMVFGGFIRHFSWAGTRYFGSEKKT